MKDEHRTLDELEGVAWGEPESASHLVQTVHALRKKPIGEFTTEDLRICIGQRVGLQWLVPRALAVLERDSLAEGAFYEGDLLLAVVHACPSFSQDHALLARLQRVTEDARKRLEDRADLRFVLDDLELARRLPT